MEQLWHSNNDFFGFTKQNLIFFCDFFPLAKIKGERVELCGVNTKKNNKEFQDV